MEDLIQQLMSTCWMGQYCQHDVVADVLMASEILEQLISSSCLAELSCGGQGELQHVRLPKLLQIFADQSCTIRAYAWQGALMQSHA